MSSQIATFATIFFSMILVNNYVLVQFLGICRSSAFPKSWIPPRAWALLLSSSWSLPRL
mgnify:CR=1 FL=1